MCARAEAAALEAAAALAVAVALVRTLPKFLSPYLPAMLSHTLDPVVRGNTDGQIPHSRLAVSRLPTT